MGIGDWGLGIAPIPNPQSPIEIINNQKVYILNLITCLELILLIY